MKDSYDQEFRAVRKEISQCRSFQTPWMGTHYLWTYPPQRTLHPHPDIPTDMQCEPAKFLLLNVHSMNLGSMSNCRHKCREL